MSYESTVDFQGRITIPKAVRDRLGVETGTKALFRFDPDGAVRLVFVDSEPMDRFQSARERASEPDIDVSEIVADERSDWE